MMRRFITAPLSILSVIILGLLAHAQHELLVQHPRRFEPSRIRLQSNLAAIDAVQSAIWQSAVLSAIWQSVWFAKTIRHLSRRSLAQRGCTSGGRPRSYWFVTERATTRAR